MSGKPGLKMSELADASGVSAGTIKHYLREGLLPEPMRTSRNMAYYDARLAERVRVIKQLQRECFLPLEHIDAILEPAPSARIRADLDELLRRDYVHGVPFARLSSSPMR